MKRRGERTEIAAVPTRLTARLVPNAAPDRVQVVASLRQLLAAARAYRAAKRNAA